MDIQNNKDTSLAQKAREGNKYTLKDAVVTAANSVRTEQNTTAVPKLGSSMHNPTDCGGGVPLKSTYQINSKVAPVAAGSNSVRTEQNTTAVSLAEPLMHNPADCGGIPPKENATPNNQTNIKSNIEYIPTLADCITEIIANIKTTMNAPSISTGFSGIDQVFGGSLPAGIVTIGGTPGSGKSALIMQLILSLAKGGRDVVYFSLEMKKTTIATRLLSHLMLQIALDNKIVPTGLVFTATEIEKGIQFTAQSQTAMHLYNQAYDVFCKYMTHIRVIDDLNGITVEEIKRKVETLTSISMNQQMPVVVIDYLQLIKPQLPSMTEKANMDHVVGVLNALSHTDEKHGGTTIFVLSALSKSGCDTLDLNSLKESNSIAFQSVNVFMLNYAAVMDAKSKPVHQKVLDDAQQQNPRKMVLSVLKNRNGPSGGHIRLDYFPAYNTFRDLTI